MPESAVASHTIVAESRLLSVGVRPEHGAKVCALTDRRTGRNWLAAIERDWAGGSGAKWQDGDCSGWDECFPNVSPGTHPTSSRPLHDHGEVWSRPWTYTAGPESVRTRIHGVELDYALSREIVVKEDTVTVGYSLANLSGERIEVGWAMHLLLDVAPTAVRIPPQTLVRVDSTFGPCGGVTAGEQWTSWAELAERLPLASTGWACKVFARDLETVEILDTDSLSVAIAAAPRPMTFGLWFNAGGWPTGDPLHHVGIEPGFGDHDDLGAASACKTSLTVEPSDAVHWTVAVRAGVA